MSVQCKALVVAMFPCVSDSFFSHPRVLYRSKTKFDLQDEVEEWKRPEDFNKAALEAKHLIDIADENKVVTIQYFPKWCSRREGVGVVEETIF